MDKAASRTHTHTILTVDRDTAIRLDCNPHNIHTTAVDQCKAMGVLGGGGRGSDTLL